MNLPTPTENNRIGIDVDGVLLDFIKGFELHASRIVGRPLTRLNEAFDLSVSYGLTKNQLEGIWAAFREERLHEMYDPIDGAVQATEMLQGLGYDLWAVTAICPTIADQRLKNLIAHGLHFPADQLICVGNDSPKDVALAKISPGMYVDDQQRYLQAIPFVPVRVWVRNSIEQVPHLEAIVAHTHEVDHLLEFAKLVSKSLDS